MTVEIDTRQKLNEFVKNLSDECQNQRSFFVLWQTLQLWLGQWDYNGLYKPCIQFGMNMQTEQSKVYVFIVKVN